MRWILIGAAALGLILGTGHPAKADLATFDFDSLAVGDSTPFSLTNNGLTASFSSPGSDPGAFEIIPSFFSTLTGNVLLTPGPAGLSNIPLVIDFSQPVTSISLNFALNTGDPTTTLDLTASLGGSIVGGASATGTVPPGFTFPEGVLSFSGLFDSVTLSTLALNFAIDNVVVEFNPGVVTPEPSSLLIAGVLGLGLFGGAVRRRRA